MQMALETEAKIKVANHESVRNRLKQLGARREGELLEVNIYFDTVDQQMLQSDRGLRLRCTRQKNVLSYKGPQQPGRYKQREEIQTTVGDPAGTQALLEQLGFVRSLLFEKRRQSWQLAQCRVELDTVAGLGCYVEVEGPSPTEIGEAIKQLELDQAELIDEPYPILLRKQVKRIGQECPEIRFGEQPPSRKQS